MKKTYLLRTDVRSCSGKFVRFTRFLTILTLVAFTGLLQGKAKASASDDENINSLLQQLKVSGVVLDESGNPLPGATIRVDGTTTGDVADTDGKFSVDVPSSNSVLVITFIGYGEQRITLAGQTTISVSMLPDIESLSEIVVVGYGVQKRTTVTGAVSVIKGDDLSREPISNISQSVSGKLAGVLSRQTGGQPGSDNSTLRIRGVNTTSTAAGPLVVVDGVIRDNLNQVDPSIIENVSILKDASAIAPYGMAGANGVILITTKKGTIGKPTLTLNSYYGVQSPTYMPDLLSAVDYMKLRNEALANEGSPALYSDDLIENYDEYVANDPDRYAKSNVQDLFDLTMPVQKHDLQLSGGSENMTYFAGIGYYDQQGLFEDVDYERWNYNINLSSKVTNNTTVSLSTLGSIETTNDLDHQIGAGQVFRGAYKYLPTIPIYYSNGLWGESSGNTPVGVLKSDGYETDKTNNILSTLSIEQNIPFISGLSVKGSVSYDNRTFTKKGFHTPFYFYNVNYNTTPYTFTRGTSAQEINAATYTYLFQESQKSNRFTFQGYINYNKTFGKHEVTGLFVAEVGKNDYSMINARRNNFNLNIDELGLGSSDKTDFDNGGSSSEGAKIGYVYRVGYNYSSKYMLEVAGRYDGHYYFAPGKRFGFFPSVSLGWRVSEENFMKGIDWLTNLKIRGSWGKSGNLATSGYQYLSGYTLLGNAYAFGTGKMVQGAYVDNENNPFITWEVAVKTNIGLEASLWSDLLKVEFDYFTEDRSNMLINPNETVPYEYGLGLSQTNSGKLKGHGFELALSSRKRFSNGLDISVSGNISIAKNEVIEIFENDATYDNPNRRRTGRQYNTAFGYKSLGLFSTDEDLNSDGIIDAANDGYTITQFGVLHPGDIKYADLSGPAGVPDGKIDSNDETVIGDPDFPSAIYGLSLQADWKGFDLGMFFQGAGMASTAFNNFQTIPFFNNNSNADYEYYNDRWTPDNQDAKYPKANTAPLSNNNQTSDFWRWKTSYLRLKNVTLGYTIPQSLTKYVKIQSLRVYVTGQNVLTFSKIKHIDPENPGDMGYPNMRIWTVGANLTF